VGYFRRRLDRNRARRAVRECEAQVDASRAWEAIPSAPPARASFVRFAAPDLHQDSQRRRGIFRVAYDLQDNCGLEQVLAARLQDDLDWFEKELPIPTIPDRHAVFFFKSSAKECMSHIWSLLHTLRDADVWVEMQTFENPGRVAYEDEHQIAAVPWADKPET